MNIELQICGLVMLIIFLVLIERDRKLKIKILDAYYDVGSIKKVEAGDETYFVIETEV